MRFRFSRRAEADLEMIADYIGRSNPSRAISYVREIREHCRHLVDSPKACRLRPEIGEGIRLSVFGSYLILYVVHPKLLEIRRVLQLWSVGDIVDLIERREAAEDGSLVVG